MIALETTWEYVVMIIVAFAVGLLGGVGAALLESKTKVAADPPDTKHWKLDTFACVVIGGIAAVAVLYFFLPTREIVSTSGKSEQFYELVKLVALSLIVGSAGTVFLQTFQTRVEGALAAQAGNQATEKAAEKTHTAAGVAESIPAQTDRSLDSAAANFQTVLTGAGITAEKAAEVAPQLVEEAKKAAAEAIEPQVNTIQALAAPADPTA
jgi:hypothetical protein